MPKGNKRRSVSMEETVSVVTEGESEEESTWTKSIHKLKKDSKAKQDTKLTAIPENAKAPSEIHTVLSSGYNLANGSKACQPCLSIGPCEKVEKCPRKGIITTVIDVFKKPIVLLAVLAGTQKPAATLTLWDKEGKGPLTPEDLSNLKLGREIPVSIETGNRCNSTPPNCVSARRCDSRKGDAKSKDPCCPSPNPKPYPSDCEKIMYPHISSKDRPTGTSFREAQPASIHGKLCVSKLPQLKYDMCGRANYDVKVNMPQFNKQERVCILVEKPKCPFWS